MLAAALVAAAAAALEGQPGRHGPGARVLLDAHNAYPYQGRWRDRLERALATGIPIAIEQDLVWRVATDTSASRSIVSHGEPFTGEEPTLLEFFERIRPIAAAALSSGSRDQWPLITLNLDFKDAHPQHFSAIGDLLREYDEWLTTAVRVADPDRVEPLHLGPVLVLTGSDATQQSVFHDQVPIGAKLRVFGAVDPLMPPKRTNYRRWSNNPWSVVEPEGQNHAGDWTTEDADRLRLRVAAAHDAGLWIRFYTLNGHSTELGERMGWSAGYNFTSLAAAGIRWRAAIDAGVDFVATDQYEEYAQISPR